MDKKIPHIAILSGSIRLKRKSHRVVLYFKSFLEENKLAKVSILDLEAYNFPLFTERLSHMESPSAEVKDFAEKVKSADGLIIVTPEYNGGYPASLKNAIDLLGDEWRRKPVAIVTVSAGNFGGMNVITSLQYTLWKLKALTVPALFPVAKVGESYDALGVPTNKETTDKLATAFIDELLWCIEAKNNMEKP